MTFKHFLANVTNVKFFHVLYTKPRIFFVLSPVILLKFCRYGVKPINQSINQSINQPFYPYFLEQCYVCDHVPDSEQCSSTSVCQPGEVLSLFYSFSHSSFLSYSVPLSHASMFVSLSSSLKGSVLFLSLLLSISLPPMQCRFYCLVLLDERCFSVLLWHRNCLLYTSDAADDMQCVDLGGRRIIKKD